MTCPCWRDLAGIFCTRSSSSRSRRREADESQSLHGSEESSAAGLQAREDPAALVRVEGAHGVGDQGHAATAAQKAIGCAADAAFRCHPEENKFEVRIEGGRSCGVQPRQECVGMRIIEDVECVLLESDLLIATEVFRENEFFLVGDYQPAGSACFRYEIGAGRALQAVGRPFAKLGVVGIVSVGRRDQKDAALADSFDEAIEVGDDLFGARDVKFPAGEHEVGLRIFFPENCLR
jgi:hypothetical protein